MSCLKAQAAASIRLTGLHTLTDYSDYPFGFGPQIAIGMQANVSLRSKINELRQEIKDLRHAAAYSKPAAYKISISGQMHHSFQLDMT